MSTHRIQKLLFTGIFLMPIFSSLEAQTVKTTETAAPQSAASKQQQIQDTHFKQLQYILDFKRVIVELTPEQERQIKEALVIESSKQGLFALLLPMGRLIGENRAHEPLEILLATETIAEQLDWGQLQLKPGLIGVLDKIASDHAGVKIHVLENNEV